LGLAFELFYFDREISDVKETPSELQPAG
jgi:hypothetical protein